MLLRTSLLRECAASKASNQGICQCLNASCLPHCLVQIYVLDHTLSRSLGLGGDSSMHYFLLCPVLKERTLKQIKRKYIPWLGEWLEIFGRDRADGGISENLHQAYNAVNGRSTAYETMDGDSPSYATNEEINTSMLQGKGKEKIVGESSIKKRKSSDNANDIDKEFMGMMRNMCSELVEGFQMLANGMGLGFDVAKARNDVYEALGEFERVPKSRKRFL